MQKNGFRVTVVGGIETPDGYVRMDHGQRYRLSLHNNHGVRCDARVQIDGNHVGMWRIEPHSSITLERPARDDGHFTFYKMGTIEAHQAGIQDGDDMAGLISVEFLPEKKRPVKPRPIYEPIHSYASAAVSPTVSHGSLGIRERGVSAGGTGLSGHSDQRFSIATEIEYDHSQYTGIHLRLVANDPNTDNPRPLSTSSQESPVPPSLV